MRWVLALAWAACISQGFAAAAENSTEADKTVQRLKEEQLYLTAYKSLLHPSYWTSYMGKAYFFTEDHSEKRTFTTALVQSFRSYKALTNVVDKYGVITNALAKGGVSAGETDNIFIHPDNRHGSSALPRLKHTVKSVTGFKLLQSLENGDALIQVGDSTYYVFEFGRAADGGRYAAQRFVIEGLKTYTTVLGGSKTVESLSILHEPNQQQRDLLNRAAKGCAMRIGEIEKDLAQRKRAGPGKHD